MIFNDENGFQMSIWFPTGRYLTPFKIAFQLGCSIGFLVMVESFKSGSFAYSFAVYFQKSLEIA